MARTASLLLVALLLIALARGDFEISQVPGLYFLKRGPPSCEEDVVLQMSGTKVAGAQIRGRNFECKGGFFTVERGTKKNGNSLTRYFAAGLGSFGVFLIGKVRERIFCAQRGSGNFVLEKGLVFNFIDPRIDIHLSFGRNVVRKKAPLADAKDITLYDEIEYMFIGDSCLYRQSWFICFPASSVVQLRDGSTKRMDQVEIGDAVKTGDGKYSDVFMWTHKQHTSQTWTFVRIATHTGLNITLTHAHHIRANGKLVPASKVVIGDTLQTGDGRAATVTSVYNVQERGFYNPQTMHGDIVVDGIVASTYTKAIRPRKAHALLAPLRALYKHIFAAPASASSASLAARHTDL